MRIDVESAEVSFGDMTIFAGITATFPPHTVTALVGPSGSGKSTLLAAMAGFHPLTSGHIRLTDGNGTSVVPDEALVAWVPQGLNALGTRTAIDNIMIASLAGGETLERSREAALSWLDIVGLAAQRYSLARTLSGGELQRLAIARALASSKPLIFADEPSANLDAVNTAKVAALLANLATTATVVVATHDPELVSAASHVVELRHK